MSKPSRRTSPTTIALHVLFAPLYIAAVLPEIAAIGLLLAVRPIVAAVGRRYPSAKVRIECNSNS
jgi:hypothetical protein